MSPQRTLSHERASTVVTTVRRANLKYRKIAVDFRISLKLTGHARLRAHKLGLKVDTIKAYNCPQNAVSVIPLPVLDMSGPPRAATDVVQKPSLPVAKWAARKRSAQGPPEVAATAAHSRLRSKIIKLSPLSPSIIGAPALTGIQYSPSYSPLQLEEILVRIPSFPVRDSFLDMHLSSRIPSTPVLRSRELPDPHGNQSWMDMDMCSSPVSGLYLSPDLDAEPAKYSGALLRATVPLTKTKANDNESQPHRHNLAKRSTKAKGHVKDQENPSRAQSYPSHAQYYF